MLQGQRKLYKAVEDCLSYFVNIDLKQTLLSESEPNRHHYEVTFNLKIIKVPGSVQLKRLVILIHDLICFVFANFSKS